jgi:hypothetical protein
MGDNLKMWRVTANILKKKIADSRQWVILQLGGLVGSSVFDNLFLTANSVV